MLFRSESTTTFLSMNKECAKEIKDAQAQILDLEQQMFSKEEFRRHMDAIRTTLEAARRDAQTGIITAEFVSRYIDKIVVTPEGDHTLRLDIRIFTGESTKKYLQNLRIRAGQMTDGSDAKQENSRDSKDSADESRTGQMSKNIAEKHIKF